MPLSILLERNYISCTWDTDAQREWNLCKPHIRQNQLLQGEQLLAFSSITRHIQIDIILYIAIRNKF